MLMSLSLSPQHKLSDVIVDAVWYRLLGGGDINCKNSTVIVCQFYDSDLKERLHRAYKIRILLFNQTYSIVVEHILNSCGALFFGHKKI